MAGYQFAGSDDASAATGGRRHVLGSGIVDPIVLSEHGASEGDSLTERTGVGFDARGCSASAELPRVHGSVVPVDRRG